MVVKDASHAPLHSLQNDYLQCALNSSRKPRLRILRNILQPCHPVLPHTAERVERENMKGKSRSCLGANPAVLKLLLILLLLSSSNMVGVGARKSLSQKAVSRSKQENSLKVSRSSNLPAKQAGVSKRRIPPSNSNPTQNKSRPRFGGSGSGNP